MDFMQWEFEGKDRFKISNEKGDPILAPVKETLSHFTYRMAKAGIKKVTVEIAGITDPNGIEG